MTVMIYIYLYCLQTADVDGDGIISMDDFRSMLDPAIAASVRKTSVTQNQSHATLGSGAGASSTSTVGFSSKS